MDSQRKIGVELARVMRLMNRSVENDAHNGVTFAQGKVIEYLCVNSGANGVFQRDIERDFEIRRSSATGLLQLMEKNGLITRTPVDYDARLKKIEPTKRALKLNECIARKISEHERLLKSGLSEEELEMFFSVLDKIRANIESIIENSNERN